MEELEVTTHWIYILTPGALFNEHATSIPKLSFDTVFLLFTHKYVSQADPVIPPTKVEIRKRQHEGIKEAKERDLARKKKFNDARKS